jgi:hypothetical protein
MKALLANFRPGHPRAFFFGRCKLRNRRFFSLAELNDAVHDCSNEDHTALELKSVTHELSDSDRMLPAGPGADQINNNCLACHSADMVLMPGRPR